MVSMTAFADELIKISNVGSMLRQAKDVATPFAKKYWKPAALVGGGAAGMHFGKGEVDKYLLGRRVHEQMSQRG